MPRQVPTSLRVTTAPRPNAVLAPLALGALALLCSALTAVAADGSAEDGVVQVAPPTGDRAKDQASVRAALDSVAPDGTVRFGPGTYVIGSPGIVVATSGVTLIGHSEGTTLQGSTSAEMADIEEEEFFRQSAGLVLTGARQTVRGLTFEHFSIALWILAPRGKPDAPPGANVEGGHLIEGNTFRNSVSVQTHVNADAAVVFRKNRFRNTYHAIAIMGRNVHFLENDVAAPQPERVPFGWPSLAIGLRPEPGVPCNGNRIEGNTIDGHTDGVVLGVLPPDGPGEVCEGNTIRNNTIRMRPLVHSKDAGPLAGTPAIGVPIRLINLQTAVGTGAMTFPMPTPPGGWPPEFAKAAVRNNVVEGNQIEGAKGVGIELVFASGNRVANNKVGAVTPLTEAEYEVINSGRTFGIGPGFWLKLGGWPAANGTGIWVSTGSEGNTVEGNTVAGSR